MPMKPKTKSLLNLAKLLNEKALTRVNLANEGLLEHQHHMLSKMG